MPMTELPAIIGSATDAHLIQQFSAYFEQETLSHNLWDAINTWNREKIEEAWTKWIDLLNEIEDGMLCVICADHGVISNRLYRDDWSEIWSNMTKTEVRKDIEKSLNGIRLTILMIGSEEERRSALEDRWEESDFILIVNKVAIIVLRITSIRHGFEEEDLIFYHENGYNDDGTRRFTSGQNVAEIERV